MPASRLRVVILKPSKYGEDGFVERFRWGFMPNGTVPHLKSMTPDRVGGVPCEVHAIDEYVHTDLRYLSLLHGEAGRNPLPAPGGVARQQPPRAAAPPPAFAAR